MSDVSQVDTRQQVLLLMTVTLRNDFRPMYQPDAKTLYVEKTLAGTLAETESIKFALDLEGGLRQKEQSDYNLRLTLEPNTHYVLRGIYAQTELFPIRGRFFIPLHEQLNVQAPGVYYLGHVQAVVRERKNNAFRAGAEVPVTDQITVGAANGTFDVQIEDRYTEDVAMLREKFPALKDADIKKQLLAAFDPAVAQKWWETH